MPTSIERRIVCALESGRGAVRTLCGVSVDVDWTKRSPKDRIVTCPLCIEEKERRWREDSDSQA